MAYSYGLELYGKGKSVAVRLYEVLMVLEAAR